MIDEKIRARNLFRKPQSSVSDPLRGPCIFVSHTKKDRKAAQLIAQALLNLSVDIYFDEHDPTLQECASGDDQTIVTCIEEGLNQSTHFLGLITPHTKNSWWVPYEIGGAMARKRPCGHIVTADTEELPSFIKTHDIILTQEDFIRWVRDISADEGSTLFMKLKNFEHYETLSRILPSERSRDRLKYY